MSRVSLKDATNLLTGNNDNLVLTVLDAALGPGLVATAPVTGGLALALFDPKNDLVKYLDKCRSSFGNRIGAANRYLRSELVSAAHTIIVSAGFFDEVSRISDLIALKLNRSGIADINTGRSDRSASEKLVLYYGSASLPAPDMAVPYKQMLKGLTKHYEQMAARLSAFITDLAIWDSLNDNQQRMVTDYIKRSVPKLAVKRYEGYLFDLARTAPEVLLWVNLHQMSALQDAVALSHREIATIQEMLRSLTSQSRVGLLSVQKALVEISGQPSAEIHWKSLADGYATSFKASLLESAEHIVPSGLTIPRLDSIYVPPAFRLIRVGAESKPSENRWWEDAADTREDLEEFIAGHITSPQATENPLLVLGNPGAGKSVLMRAIAARLSAAGYRLLRVDLRHVPSDSPVLSQVEMALRHALSRNLDWGEMTDALGGSMPVLLLDGFDELLQASGTDRSDYIEQIKEFQRTEAQRGSPVIVVVTSRTVVMNRARVPLGSLIVRLEPFDRPRIELWLDAWRSCNSSINAGEPGRILSSAEALAHKSIAEQPLLLLMLAIFVADGNQLPVSAGLSSAAAANAYMYERILESFARREALRRYPSADQGTLQKAIEKEFQQLSIAAFAMFNRGSQHVTESDLDKELALFVPQSQALEQDTLARPTAAQELVARFFFVHVSLANVGVSPGAGSRTYEFLHATFGEYLTARLIAASLNDLTKILDFQKTSAIEFDDNIAEQRLHALLSFQLLSQRRQVIDFLTEIRARESPESLVAQRIALLDMAKTAARKHLAGDYQKYMPTRVSLPGRIARYQANTVLVLLTGGAVEVSSITEEADSVADAWRKRSGYWRSQLKEEEWSALRDCLTVSEGDNDITVELSGESHRSGSAAGQMHEIVLSNRLILDRDIQVLLDGIEPLLSYGDAYFISRNGEPSAARRIMDLGFHADLADDNGIAGRTSQYLTCIATVADLPQNADRDRYLTWVLKQYLADQLMREKPEITLQVVRAAIRVNAGVISKSYVMEAAIKSSNPYHHTFQEIRALACKMATEINNSPREAQLGTRRAIQIGFLLKNFDPNEIPSAFGIIKTLERLATVANEPQNSDLVREGFAIARQLRLELWARQAGFATLQSLSSTALACVYELDLKYLLDSAMGGPRLQEINTERARWKSARKELRYFQAPQR